MEGNHYARMTGDVGKTSTKMGRETHGDEIFLTLTCGALRCVL